MVRLSSRTRLVYEVAAHPADPSVTGIVRVRFSELPVAQWSRLSNEEKRARGITKCAGVSVVRAGREVDYGWFFLGEKRRENYDDWWRCEISSIQCWMRRSGSRTQSNRYGHRLTLSRR